MKSVAFVSLGCAKNLVDTEVMIAALGSRGWRLEGDAARADAVVINTCAFIDPAKAESTQTILEHATAKRPDQRLVVAGCLAQRYGEQLQALIPQIDGVVGTGAYASIAELLEEVEAGARPVRVGFAAEPEHDFLPRLVTTPRATAYLKIAEGCDHPCTFCIIPSLRGDLVSRPIGDVLVEAERLFRAGVHELLVVSQDTSAYGVDLRYRTGFWQGRPMKTRAAELARELAALARAHDAWVRLHYVYPYPHVDELVPLMTGTPTERGLLAYLDVPFQHASPRILRLMKRPAAPEKVLDRIRAWREARPAIVLRSTFIAGFPGETDAEFDELLDFLREAALDRVGCFAYSPVEGAAANALPGAVPEALREERRARLMALQATISTARLAGRVGHIEDVLVDRVERDVAIARSVADAPEIDGIVRIRDAGGCSAGEFVRVAVTGSGAHDLEAEIVSGREASPARDRPRARQRSLRSPH